MASVTDTFHWQQAKTEYLKNKRRTMPRNQRDPARRGLAEKCDDSTDLDMQRNHRGQEEPDETLRARHKSCRARSDSEQIKISEQSAGHLLATPCGSTTVSECGSEDFADTSKRSNGRISESPPNFNGRSAGVDGRYLRDSPERDYRADLRNRGEQVLADLATTRSSVRGLNTQAEAKSRLARKRGENPLLSHNHAAHYHMRPGAPEFIPASTVARASSIPPPPDYPAEYATASAQPSSRCLPPCPPPNYAPPSLPCSSPVPLPPPVSPTSVASISPRARKMLAAGSPPTDEHLHLDRRQLAPVPANISGNPRTHAPMESAEVPGAVSSHQTLQMHYQYPMQFAPCAEYMCSEWQGSFGYGPNFDPYYPYYMSEYDGFVCADEFLAQRMEISPEISTTDLPLDFGFLDQ